MAFEQSISRIGSDGVEKRGTRNAENDETGHRSTSFDPIENPVRFLRLPSSSVKFAENSSEQIDEDGITRSRCEPFPRIYALFDYRNYLFWSMNTFLVENCKPSNWNIWRRDESCSDNSSFLGSKVRFSLFWILCGIIIKPFLSSLCFLLYHDIVEHNIVFLISIVRGSNDTFVRNT